MPHISTMFVGRMLSHAPEKCDREELLSLCGLNEKSLLDRNAHIAAPAYFSMLERMAECADGIPDFHLKTAATMRCDDLGAAGLACKVAPTLQLAFDRLGRYVQILTRLQRFETQVEADLFRLVAYRPLPLSRGAELSYEASLLTALSLGREVTGVQIVPRSVRYTHSNETSRPVLTEHFGCTIEFSADRDELVLELRDAERTCPLSDTSIWSYFQSQLDEQTQSLARETSLVDDLEQWVTNAFTNGVPTIKMAAKALGLAERTMQRRLADKGVSYNKVVDRCRERLATHLLRNSEQSLVEIAFLTGFSDQSAFNRAFRRWHGVTPKDYRTDTRN